MSKALRSELAELLRLRQHLLERSKALQPRMDEIREQLRDIVQQGASQAHARDLARATSHAARNAEMCELVDGGAPVAEVAARYGIKPQRVREIHAKHRRIQAARRLE